MASASDVANRVPITVAMMLATVMTSLDMTIANVALPHMQGSLNAAQDQITWVLTAYIVAQAIMTPLSGWLSLRIGRKTLLVISITAFTATSMMCGLATSLWEIVLFRFLQGAAGASLIPLSQATVLDIYPREQVPQVMAVWGAGAILGPIFGPALGGWLTDNLSWRWVFFINLPVGVLALLGLFLFMSSDRGGRARPFDFVGFGALTMFIAGFQWVLDRGPGLDWFSDLEIWVAAILSLVGGWMFVVQTISAQHPFFDRALALDRNFVVCNLVGFSVGILLFSPMALLPPMLQGLMGYSVLESGLVTMPRGLGSFAAMFVVGRAMGVVDIRFILLTGLSLCGVALWQMMNFDLSMNSRPVVLSGVIQGFGTGLIFVPLSTLAFGTLAPEHRAEATSLYTLTRNLGSAIGISVMQFLFVRNSQVVHSTLAENVDPARPALQSLPAHLDPATLAGLQSLNGEVSRQAAMVAYVDDYRLMFFLTLAVMPLMFLMRSPRRDAQGAARVSVE
jgi:DHA2 family multidrug resistance protein